MKTLRIVAITLLVSLGLAAQTQVTVTLSVKMAATVAADFHQRWLGKTAGTLGKTSAAIDATSTSIQVTIDTTGLSQQGPAFKVGDEVAIGAEPCSVTAAASQSFTCTRAEYALSPMVTHSSGDIIVLLKYASPWVMVDEEALRPYAIQTTTELGKDSATFGSQISGTITAQ